MTFLVAMAMLFGRIMVVAQIAVVLQQMHEHLRHAHPLLHVRGTEAIEGEGEEEEGTAHRGAKVMRRSGANNR